MKISHQSAVRLENIVRGVFNCERGDVCGLANADIYVCHPLEAAVACTAALYRKSIGDETEDQVSEFFNKWRTAFNANQNDNQSEFFNKWRTAFNANQNDNQDDMEREYIGELRAIVNILKSPAF